MPDDVADRLMAQAAGNPLALVELPDRVRGEQLAGAAPLPAQLHLTAGIERVFLDRCRRLPPAVQTLLLVAAADDSGHVATVRARRRAPRRRPRRLDARNAPGCSSSTATPCGCGTRWSAPRCTRPRPAGNAARRTGARRRPRRRRRPRPVRVAPRRGRRQPRRAVVTGLTAAAARAERRGGYAAASAAYQRAAELTADEQRAPLLYAAARNAWSAGQTTQARALSAAARELADDRVLRADIDRLRGRIEVNVGSATDAHHIFAAAARAVLADDPTRALELAVAAALLSTYGADSGTTLDVTALAAGATTSDTARTRCLGHLLLALTQRAAHGWAPGLASLRAALDAGADLDDLDLLVPPRQRRPAPRRRRSPPPLLHAMAAGARDAGAGMLVLYALPRLGFTQVVTGRWAALRGSAEEALSLSASAGQPPLAAAPLGWVTVLAALQGRPAADYDQLLADLDTAARQPLGVLADPVHDLTRWAQGTRAAHDGDTRAALHHLASIRISAISRLTAVDRIDAAVRAGDHEQAARG